MILPQKRQSRNVTFKQTKALERMFIREKHTKRRYRLLYVHTPYGPFVTDGLLEWKCGEKQRAFAHTRSKVSQRRHRCVHARLIAMTSSDHLRFTRSLLFSLSTSRDDILRKYAIPPTKKKKTNNRPQPQKGLCQWLVRTFSHLWIKK